MIFFKANKAQYQHAKIRHFLEIANFDIKRAWAESFSYNLLNFYNSFYFFCADHHSKFIFYGFIETIVQNS